MSTNPAIEAPADDWIAYFLQPKYRWLYVASVSGFFTLFMIGFQPFGVTNHDPDFSISFAFIVLIFGFGAAVAAVLALSEFVMRPLVLPNPKQRGWISWLAFDYLLVATTVFLIYNYAGNWHDFHWSSWFGFIRDIAMVMSIPVVGFVYYVRHQALAVRYVRLTAREQTPPSTRLLHLSSDNEKDVLSVAFGDLLYLRTQDNYVEVVYLDNGSQRSSLIRSTLKRMESLADYALVRCHRSFAVNPDRVVGCQGNRHGLKLQLDGVDQPVPVSRAYTESVLQRLGADSSAVSPSS